MKLLWNRLGIRIIVGWLIICVIPMILCWQVLPKDATVINLINSWLASSMGLIIILILLDRFTRLPGQDSMLLVVPCYFTVVGILAMLFFIFRIPYSVYYLFINMPLVLIFCFVSQFIIRITSKPILAYIPVGRYQELLKIKNVHWIELAERTPFYYKDVAFSALIVDLSDSQLSGEWEKYLAKLTIQGVPVYNFLQAKETLTGRLPIRHLYENNLGSLLPPQELIAIKRIIDTLFIIAFLPLILLIIGTVALAIYLEEKNSKIFFTQYRVGQGGKVFKMYKFRSMRIDAPNQNTLMTQANDDRITKVGKVIRQWRIDELPQFYNVLKGEMSLIGPRPELPSEVERLEKEIPFYIYRQIVKPGISGWAQVMQGEGHVENIQTKLEYDFYYIKNFSFTLDFLIVIKTIQTMLTGFGAR